MKEISIDYVGIVFDAKPDAVPYKYRISYKVTQLCLIMKICGRKGVCSLIKLHMISHALISNDNMKCLIEYVNGSGNVPIVRFDPSVNRALTYAIGFGLIEQQKNSKFILSDRGILFTEQILAVGDLMVAEISELRLLSKKLTEKMVDDMVFGWRNKDVKD